MLRRFLCWVGWHNTVDTDGQLSCKSCPRKGHRGVYGDSWGD